MIQGIKSIFKEISNMFKGYVNSDQWEDLFDKLESGKWECSSQSIVSNGDKTTVKVNGQTIELKGHPSVSIKNSKVYVNGKEIDKSQYQVKNDHITVVFKGDVDNITAEGDNVNITVNNVGNSVKNTNGDIKVLGSVQGNVSTTNGDITVKGSIFKSVTTVNGDIYK